MHKPPLGALRVSALLGGAFLVGAFLVGNSLLVGCRPSSEKPAAAPVKQAAPPDALAQNPLAESNAKPASPSKISTSEGSGQLPQPAILPAATAAAAEMTAHTEVAAAGPGPAANDAVAAKNVEASASQPETSWSTHRLVLLSAGGPQLVDLRVNIDGSDLSDGLTEATEWLAHQLEFDFEQPISWEALLEKPLIQSGWFGNLVPSAEQRAELLSLYDKENAGTVDVQEFQAFMTRGLSRRQQIRLIQGPATAPLLRSSSAWGPLDRDEDGRLNKEELSQVSDALMRFDFDGDGIITESELRSSSDTMASADNISRSRGLLDLDLVLTIDPDQPAAFQRAVLEHYTFADAIPREEFFRWDDRRWDELDSQRNGEITKRDLARLPDLVADAQVDVAFPNSVDESLPEEANRSEGSIRSNAPPAQREVHPEPERTAWSANSTGGRLSLPGCIVILQLRDDQSWRVRSLAVEQFARAVEEPPAGTALAGALELKEGAWELVRALGASGPSAAWNWLAAPRHFHVTARWTIVEAPWFELLDANGDRKLTHLELSGFRAATKPWDRNLNDKLEEDELPLVVSMTVTREDSRLANFSMGGMTTEKRGANSDLAPSWFIGMDYNSDGEVTHAEFLGEDSAFEALDADGDGIIDAREVYAPH